MTTREYEKAALRTESNDALTAAIQRLQDPQTVRLLHAVIGLCTETGELQDAVKKHVFYGKPLDLTNLAEEMGDLFWYLAVLNDVLGTHFEGVMQINIDKLTKRYPDTFTEFLALNRDLDAERKVLEKEPTGPRHMNGYNVSNN